MMNDRFETSADFADVTRNQRDARFPPPRNFRSDVRNERPRRSFFLSFVRINRDESNLTGLARW